MSRSIVLFFLLFCNAHSVWSAFNKLNCIIRDDLPVQWQNPNGQLKSGKDMFVVVESEGKLISLNLYIKKSLEYEGVYVCNNRFWKVIHDMEPVLLTGEETVQFSWWNNDTENKPKLSWADRAVIFINTVRNLPILLQIIIGFTLVIYAISLGVVCLVSSILYDASKMYSKIAFIMTEGNKVRTLQKLKMQFSKHRTP